MDIIPNKFNISIDIKLSVMKSVISKSWLDPQWHQSVLGQYSSEPQCSSGETSN